MSEFDNNNEQDIIRKTENEAAENISPDVENIAQTAAPEEPWGELQTAGAELVGGVEPVKKSGFKILAIIIAIVLVLAAGCVCAYAFIPQVKNTVKMLINSPEDYYAWVEKENAEDTAEKLLEFKDKYSGVSGEELSLEASLNSDSIKELLSKNESVGSALSSLKLPDSISIDAKSAVIDEVSNGNAAVSIGGEQLMTVNSYMKDGKYYFQIPEISKSYLCFDPTAILDKASASFDDEDQKLAENIKKFLNSAVKPNTEQIISDDDLKKLIIKYTDIAAKEFTKAELEKDCEVNIEDVSAKYAKITVSIDQGMMFSVIKNVLEEVKNDDVIGDMFDKMMENGKDTVLSSIDQLLEKFGNLEIKGGDEIAVMEVYVNSKGEIMGRTITTKNTAESDEDVTTFDNTQLGYTLAKDGNKLGAEIFIVNGAGEKTSVDISAEENSDKYTGKAYLSTSDKKDVVSAEFKDLECDDDGFASGSVAFGLSSFGLDDIKLDLDRDGKTQKASFDITYEGNNICTLSAELTREVPEKIIAFNGDLPVIELADDNGIDQYTASIDDASFKEVYKKLFDALGLDMAQLGVDLDNPMIWEQVKSSFSQTFGGVFRGALSGGLDQVMTSGGTGGIGVIEDDINGLSEGNDLLGAGDGVQDADADADDDFSFVNSDYDLNKLSIEIDGKSYKVGDKADMVLKYITDISIDNADTVKPDGQKLKPNSEAYCYDYNYTLDVSFKNTGEKEAELKDCAVEHISVTEGSKLDIKVDGVGLGEDPAKILEKMGEKMTASEGIISIYADGDYNKTLEIEVTDNKITGFRIYDFTV